MRPRLALFDLDDTLADYSAASVASIEALASLYPVLSARPLDEVCETYERLVDEWHERFLAGRVSLEAARLERMRRLFAWCGCELPERELAEAERACRSAYALARRPVPGARPLLEAVRRHARVGVVSNHASAEQVEKLGVIGLADLVDFVVTAEDAGEPKPGQRIFALALDRAGCRADEAVMVGDSWRSDVLGAVRAGIRAVWLNRRCVACPDPGLAREIRSLEPVEDALRALGLADARARELQH